MDSISDESEVGTKIGTHSSFGKEAISVSCLLKRVYRKLKRKFSGVAQESQIERLQQKGLVIGKNNIIHSPDCFDIVYPWLIEIGDNNMFSTEVKVLAHDSSTNRIDGITKVGRVSIGNNCYFGCRSLILCNTHIGDNVIIGAGSVVCKDCRSNSVYAGNPAKYMFDR